MNIQQYFARINQRFNSGISTEHSYRGDLQSLLETLCSDSEVTNEPVRISCGAPDYILTKKSDNNIPIGYIEAKDLSENNKLDSIEKSEQITRYRASLNNLILTNYIEFRFFLDGEKVTQIVIAKIDEKKLVPLAENWPAFENLIRNFSDFTGLTIRSAPKLAEMMAKKARLMQQVLQNAVESDVTSLDNSSLKDQMLAFKNVLIHDITPSAFADIYAQTIAYGLFAARLHDSTLSTFNRQEAAELIPKSNPFLKKLFGYIAGVDIDERIIWIVDALCEVFRVADVFAILKNFGKATRMEDPMIHFYETFLTAYNPKLRKSRGVWYTPAPIVNFIVRAVGDILKNDFKLPMGLADNSKITVKRKAFSKATSDKRSKIKQIEFEEEVHKVQILDPATGTGTFLAEVIKQIYDEFEDQQGIWSKYTEEHLIPRLHGFELLMASYAMAHLKLDLLLKQTGYIPSKKENRLRVYLTNSLEEAHPDTMTLFASWLSQEASEANNIKMETPVMVVLGNPPYSGESANKGNWIMKLMEDYKREPGGKEKLREKNSKWINADEYKFIRLGEYLIEKNNEGILAYINPHGFLDNPTLRGMRWRLLKAFDKIYIIDLHGNTNKEERRIEGQVDQNVFDIMQGVSINIFIKTNEKKESELGKVLHYDIYGKREDKYNFLGLARLEDIKFEHLENRAPHYYFKFKDFQFNNSYEKGFSINDLFPINGNGIVTKRDQLCIQDSQQSSYNSARDILNLPKDKFYERYNIPPDVRDWRYEWAVEDIANSNLKMELVQKISYRPFDTKFIYYTGRSRGFVGWPVYKIMHNYINRENIGLLCPKSFSDAEFAHVFVTETISEAIFLSSKTGSNAMNFPLYLYQESRTQISMEFNKNRVPNLSVDIIKEIAHRTELEFTNEKSLSENTFAPIDILDYIYAILHSPSYRKKYKELLKTDFPRIPYPKNNKMFKELIDVGSQLRELHLLKHPILNKRITKYDKPGDNKITRLTFQSNNVFINDTQYFENVPMSVWEFYVGGYQPAQKWLKDRRGQTLSFEDIMHYQKIVAALSHTDFIIKSIQPSSFE